LLVIAHVSAEAQRDTSSMLDLEIDEVQFGLTARQQSDSGAGLGKSDCQALADPPASPRYEYTLVF
jgi:hypothetical protein